MQFKKSSVLVCSLVLLFSLFLLFGCTSTTSICGDSVCSSEEAINCTCTSDCGACNTTSPTDNNSTIISTLPLSTPISSSVTEIDISPLVSNVNLSSLVIPSINVSGSVVLPSKEDYLRVILVDDKGKEFLVFEAYYPLYNLGTSSFENICNETCNLSQINPSKLKIETNISDFSKINIFSLSISSGAKLSQKDSAVNLINKNLRENNESWVAGETSVSKLSYADKKAMYGNGSVAPPAGFEYYSSGVFGDATAAQVLLSTSSSSSTTLPTSWDWRNRNGKNWISPVKSQGHAGLCWAFASVAAVESSFNLYYNDLLNYDLAEKEFNCGVFNDFYFSSSTYGYGSDSLTGGYPYQGLGYIKKSGVVEESCIPYLLTSSGYFVDSSCSSATTVNCSNFTLTSGRCAVNDTNCAFCKTKNFAAGVSACSGKTMFSISDFKPVGDDNYSIVTDLNILKKALIEKGPLTVGSSFYNVLNSDANISAHAMLLVGYETDSIGRTILIFKNSWGSDWGADGYAKTYFPSIHQVFYVLNPTIKSNGTNPLVKCVDEDNDSYCSWGIGAKPSTCSTSCNALEDCDDSNPGLRAFDSNYNCVNVSSGKIQITSSPTDANVYLNKVYKGKTPLTLDVNAGTINVLVKKDEFKSFASRIDVAWKETKVISAVLERDPNLIWKDYDIIAQSVGKQYYESVYSSQIRILVDSLTNDTNKEIFYFSGAPVGSNTSSTLKDNYPIKSAYVCERSSGANCVANSLKQITFRAGAVDINVPDGGIVQSDLIDYKLDKSKDYLVILFVTGYAGAFYDDSTSNSSSIDDYKSNDAYASDTNILKVINYSFTTQSKKNIKALKKIVGTVNTAECGNLECEPSENYSSCPTDCAYVAPVITFTDSAKAEYNAYLLKSNVSSLNYILDNNYYSKSTTSYVPSSPYLLPSTSFTDGNTITYKYLTKTRTDANYLSNASTSPSTSLSISIFDADTNKSFSCSRMISAYYTTNWSCTCNPASSGGAASEIKVAKLDSETILGQNAECYLWRTVVQSSGQDTNYVQCFNSKGITLKNETYSLSSSVSSSMTVNTNLYSLSKAKNLVESSSLSQIIPKIGSEGEKIFTCLTLATECVPGQTDLNKTGSNVGLCKERIVNKVCDSGFWTQTITQEGVLPSTEVCDVNLYDEDCDGTSNEGCACVNATQADCTLSDLCKLGKTTCNSGVWGTCTEVGTKTVNSSCGAGKACSNLGVCTTIACTSDSVCPNTTGKVCKSAKCLSPGDYNSSCTIQNLPFGTSCGTSLSCDNSGECAAYPCTTNSDCVSANSCQTGVCQSSVCNFVNKAENTDCNTGKKCNSTGQCTLVTCDSNSQCTSTNSCKIGTCNSPGLWNSSCVFENKTPNTSCGAVNVCDTNVVCVAPLCSATNVCTSTNPCKDASCTSAGNWNASCLLTNKAVNSICGTNQKCNSLGECKTIACTSDANCVSSNTCQVGVCSSSGDYNATCSYSNKIDNSPCGVSSSCTLGVCQKYSKVIYDSNTFNGTSAPATLTVDNNLSIDRNYVGSKEVLISSSSEKAVLFTHNFSTADLNLLNTTVQKGNIDGNRNYLIVKGLVLQGTKTIYLPKSLSNNGVCVLDSEVNDVNSAKQACTKLSCPGVSGNISCSIEGNLFAISGLTHSFVSEEYVFCGDGVCSTNESCSSCATDCNACAQNGSSSVACSTDAACGASTVIGSKFCVSNTVMQTYRDKNCLNKGTIASRCVTTDLNKLISTCSSSQTCVSGECVTSQVQPVLECTIDSNCSSSKKCVSNVCESVVCGEGYDVVSHNCVCSGKKCGTSCYSDPGICCSDEWKANKTSCAVDENTIVVDDSNKPDKRPPVSEITLLGIPIIYIGVGAIVFTVIIILIFTFLPTKK